MTRALICSIFCLFIFGANAQSVTAAYPQDYFRWPVNLKPEIVANFGELRPNHWHMGLDVRTGGHENEPVFAAADGYIAHIGIRPSSFGRFIIINHPNGLSTLYGHLNDFAPAIEAWVTEQQYKLESWAVELDPDPSLLPVRKGDLISYSGNTGGSQGPHVHFEIRSTATDECLNPLLFGFDLQDEVAPNLQGIALYDRSRSIYNVTPVPYALKLTDSGYIVPKNPVITTKHSVLGIGLRAYDRISGSNNQDGIYSASLFVDDEFISGFLLDSISYDETGYYNAHIDYRNHYRGGIGYQLLNALPNDRSGVYRRLNDGLLHLTDTLVHQVRIEVKDTRQNTSAVRFAIRSVATDMMPVETAAGQKSPVPSVATIQSRPGVASTIARPGFELSLREENIYDTIETRYTSFAGSGNMITAVHSYNDESIPVHGLLKVRLQPMVAVNASQRDRIVMLRQGGRSTTFRKAGWEGNWISAEFSDFGKFSAVADLAAPVVNAPGKGDTINLSASTRLLFTPVDASGIRSFSARINGQWIRFTNDKGRTWIYRFDERVPYGVHQLHVRVEDLAGNITEKSWWFKRMPYTPPPPKKKGSRKKSSGKTIVKKKAAVKKKGRK